MSTPTYEIHALRYATREARRHEHFIGGDPHDGPMPMDYFVWTAVSPERAFVIDTGFTAEIAAKRKRTYLRCPIESLRLLGLEPDRIEDVILTHLHYDHVGSFHRFARARFHLQEPEMHYATGRYMRFPKLRHSFEVEDVVGMVRMNFAERVVFHIGDAEIAPGISVHAIGASWGSPPTKCSWRRASRRASLMAKTS
jgi:glyoxylase-like metal-dependent hydrolase (beta-lactamase superfamily II)